MCLKGELDARGVLLLQGRRFKDQHAFSRENQASNYYTSLASEWSSCTDAKEKKELRVSLLKEGCPRSNMASASPIRTTASENELLIRADPRKRKQGWGTSD
eukprot:GHVO01037452.1.p1 GENE.GHVO01037452.1~~GHVO01037452.1.p1  ORF type:complete len:102 (+),score=2.42 GHVO01037452.1:189-494(+)